MTVVIVSNRVARPNANEPMIGGLAAALLPAVSETGAIWVGSSGTLADAAASEPIVHKVPLGRGSLATVDLPSAHYKKYYEGFANSALWPMLHSRPDLMTCSQDDFVSYKAVNAFMAQALLRFAKPDSLFWIQDYHFLTQAQELRARGVSQPLGLFLHTPWPHRKIVSTLPQHLELVRAMLAYDQIGFQTRDDQTHFEDYVRNELGLAVVNGSIVSQFGQCRLGTFPIGIDAPYFAEHAASAMRNQPVKDLKTSLQGRKLIIGVDRIDYSKGLVNRMRAVDQLLVDHPEFRRQVSMLQIAIPSREGISNYKALKDDLCQVIGEINGRHSEIDWTPIRYLNKGYGHATLAGFYRSAAIGLVTPLYDGMNLVAKEYVAAQNPDDPGVLVLSEFAGAARELDAALIVNPHDIEDVSHALVRGMTMSRAERYERWQAMMKRLNTRSVHSWFADFVSSLKRTAISPVAAPALVPLRVQRAQVARKLSA